MRGSELLPGFSGKGHVFDGAIGFARVASERGVNAELLVRRTPQRIVIQCGIPRSLIRSADTTLPPTFLVRKQEATIKRHAGLLLGHRIVLVAIPIGLLLHAAIGTA